MFPNNTPNFSDMEYFIKPGQNTGITKMIQLQPDVPWRVRRYNLKDFIGTKPLQEYLEAYADVLFCVADETGKHELKPLFWIKKADTERILPKEVMDWVRFAPSDGGWYVAYP